MKTKLVSVIIPTFDRLELLKKAINSVFSQTYTNIELIIVDDGSNDGTQKFISNFKKDIIYIKQQNKGCAAARNAGIKAAKAPLLAFLDSDDQWDKEKLITQINQMNKAPSYLISYTQEIWHKNSKPFKQEKKHKKFHGYIFDKCLNACTIGASTMVSRKELFERIGLFDENLPCCEDYDFWLRVSTKYPFLLIDKSLTIKNGGRQDQLSFIHRTGMDKYRIDSITKLLNMNNFLNNEHKQLAKKELIKKCRIYGNGCIKHGKLKEGNYYLELIKMATR